MQDFLHRKTQDTFQTYSLTEVSKNSEEQTKTRKHDHQHQKNTSRSLTFFVILKKRRLEQLSTA